GGAQIGAKTLLIEKEKIGGDCTHYGCIPSKTLIKSANKIRELKKINENIEKDITEKINIEKILSDVSNIVSKVYSHEKPEEIKKYGIEIELGEAKFLDKKSVEVNGKTFFGKNIVIASGARARIPEVKGLNDIKFMTNKEVFNPKMFKSLAVIGAGPIGAELAQAFRAFGIEVFIIEHGKKILGREDAEASKLVEERFESEGIKIYKNKEIVEVLEILDNQNKCKKIVLEDTISKEKSEINCEEILVAVGRVPNLEGLNLEKAGIDFNERGIKIDSRCRTSNKNIFAIGDVASGLQFTHFANHQGKVALTNIIFKLPLKYETKVIPRVTFTEPEVASVGEIFQTIDELVLNGDILILKKEYSQVDRAITDGNTKGFFKIFCDKKGFIKGAVIVGNSAGELIGEVSLAMKNNIKITQLADTIHPYPGYGYGLRNCADQFRSINFTLNKKKWIKKIFRLRGN
ncbi:MAG: FAD-dependent oxidoreductase, partial [Nanoarchaeota archaeon]|nr:FAD-dependent oxidoreductase [Nanoarchaeota archaeon]